MEPFRPQRTGGYTLAEIALTLPAAAMVILVCIGALHLSTRLLRQQSRVFHTDVLTLLTLRRDLASSVVVPTMLRDEFTLYNKWGQQTSPERLVRETPDLRLVSFQVVLEPWTVESHTPRRAITLIQSFVHGDPVEFRIPVRLASPSEAQFWERYGE
jgi:hypothetical protein